MTPTIYKHTMSRSDTPRAGWATPVAPARSGTPLRPRPTPTRKPRLPHHELERRFQEGKDRRDIAAPPMQRKDDDTPVSFTNKPRSGLRRPIPDGGGKAYQRNHPTNPEYGDYWHAPGRKGTYERSEPNESFLNARAKLGRDMGDSFNKRAEKNFILQARDRHAKYGAAVEPMRRPAPMKWSDRRAAAGKNGWLTKMGRMFGFGRRSRAIQRGGAVQPLPLQPMADFEPSSTTQERDPVSIPPPPNPFSYQDFLLKKQS